ncbi:MAG: flagellar basal-body MS-ring/collar protein FliF [Microthrixaceae bacterium]
MSMIDGAPPAGGAKDRINAVRDKAREVGGAFEPRTRMMMGIAFAVTIALVLGYSMFGNRTQWAPLMTNVSAQDAGAVTKQLESDGTPYQLADGGSTIQVPSDQVYKARISIAGADTSAKTGYAILDNQDITSSEFSQRIGLQRALEGEMEKTIEAIDGVSAASVHLAIPKSDAFVLSTQKATASVMVQTGGRTLSDRQVRSITNLVAGGVEGLSPGDVTVADAHGKLLASPAGGTDAAPGGDGAEQLATFERQLASSIEDMLGRIVGDGKAKATVTADLDFDSTKSVSESYAPPSTLVTGEALAVNESTKSETYSGTTAANAGSGILGPDGQPLNATDANGSGSGYQLNEKQVNNAVNKVVETTNKAPGAVRRLSVAVVVDDKAVSATELPELQNLVSAAAGITPSRGDTVAVSRFEMKPDSTTKQQLSELAFRERQNAAARSLPPWILAALGVMALALLGLVVTVLRGRRRKGEPEVVDLTDEHVGSTEDATAAARPADTSTATSAEEEVASLEEALAAASAQHPTDNVDPGSERREVLGELIDNQPDEVAQLLRSWLGDRREVPR